MLRKGRQIVCIQQLVVSLLDNCDSDWLCLICPRIIRSRIREKIDTFFSGRYGRLQIKFGDRIGMVSCRRYPWLSNLPNSAGRWHLELNQISVASQKKSPKFTTQVVVFIASSFESQIERDVVQRQLWDAGVFCNSLIFLDKRGSSAQCLEWL